MEIQASLEHVLRSEQVFGETFYRNFFQRHPAAVEFFSRADLKRLAALLPVQLTMIEVFHNTRSPASEEYFRALGVKHHNWGIPEDAYAAFCDSLLETLQSFHGELWSEDLAEQWRAALNAAVGKMLEAYQQQRFPL
jgi:hemoglobin-like flavoprotein